MRSSTTLELKGRKTLVAITLALAALPASAVATAAERDAHAVVRDSILNTWRPTAVASPTEGKMDAHERGRATIAGVSKPLAGSAVPSADRTPRLDPHEQARRLLLAQPVGGGRPVVAAERTYSGS